MKTDLKEMTGSNELETACERCEFFLKREERSLAVFTGDQRLLYVPGEKAESFTLDIKKRTLVLPMARFMEKNFDENLMLWSLYMALALYSDWTGNSKAYLNRMAYFRNEQSHMVLYLMARVESAKLSRDPAYQPDILKSYVRRELQAFFQEMDKYYAYVRVRQLCPVYRQPENIKRISHELAAEGYNSTKLARAADHQLFSRLFICRELQSEPGCEALKDRLSAHERPGQPAYELSKRTLGQELWAFYRDALNQLTAEGGGIAERDKLIRSFILPAFVRIWKADIDQMDLPASSGEKTSELNDNPFDASDAAAPDKSLQIPDQDRDKLLKELDEENTRRQASSEAVIQGKLDLASYGISAEDQRLFALYAAEMQGPRDRMRKLWKRLIGEARKEINIKKTQQSRGKLDVHTLVDRYPDFVESERRGNYKDIYIFDKYLLEPYAGILPGSIEVSFVLDNSGSMNSKKIDAARKALTVALLSLEDFEEYLRKNAEYLHQRIHVKVETWLFGSGYHQVLSYEDAGNPKKKMADRISSVVRLNGGDGTTDDGSCLEEILKGLTFSQTQEIKKKKQIKIIFEITDGASSFPGIARKAVSQLIEKGVEIYAIEIGARDEVTKKVFDYIWEEGYEDSHGLFLGNEIERLPEELLKLVSKNMKSIFNAGDADLITNKGSMAP